jgi:hypothetical protein
VKAYQKRAASMWPHRIRHGIDNRGFEGRLGGGLQWGRGPLVAERQWVDQLLPAWHRLARHAAEHGVDKLCVELSAFSPLSGDAKPTK